MNEERDRLLDQDWSNIWETLPEAPDFTPRALTAQITLRLPQSLVARIRRVASQLSLPYHALVRSWIIESLRQSVAPEVDRGDIEPQSVQLNVKLDQAVLDELKLRAHELRRPYHRLAREWIEPLLASEEASLGLEPLRDSRPAVKDLMVLLLHAQNQKGGSSIHGITRLQKLLFVIEKSMALETRFYAYNYGPFNEEVNDAAQALKFAGFMRDSQSITTGPPSFADMMATVAERSGPNEQTKAEEFALNEAGHEAAEQLRRSNDAYERIYAYIESIREEWDTDDLVDRVYEMWPDYTGKSVIRKEVERRNQKRRSS